MLNYFVLKQGFVSMSKQLLYQFFKNVQKLSAKKSIIEAIWQVNEIQPYNLKKTLVVYIPKPLSTPAKKTNMKLILKIPMLSHTMSQLIR